MNEQLKLGFLLEMVKVPIAKLVPTKPLSDRDKASERYKKIAASVREEGLSEAPVVSRDGRSSRYFILDGHVRVSVLADAGAEEVDCLVSVEDENYTYNAKVNRIAPIQANRMILKAIAAGVPEERIAKALNIEASTVRASQWLLEGICPEAVDLLKDKPVCVAALEMMKRVKPMRQIAMAELMNASKVYTGSYARAMFVGTPENELIDSAKKRRGKVLSTEDAAKIDNERRSLERDYLLLSESYGENVMELTLARDYVKKLFASGKVVRYLTQKHPDPYAALQKIVESATLE